MDGAGTSTERDEEIKRDVAAFEAYVRALPPLGPSLDYALVDWRRPWRYFQPLCRQPS